MPKGVYLRTKSIWNKGLTGVYKSNKKGKTYEEIYGEKRAKEIRKKVSENNAKYMLGRKRVFSEEWRRKIGEGNRGKKMSKEAREKISNGLINGARNKITLSVLKRKEEKAGRKRPKKCELCGSLSNRICFDHDHETGKFRGWICHRCNATLGFVEDSEELLEKMINYLRIAKKNADMFA